MPEYLFYIGVKPVRAKFAMGGEDGNQEGYKVIYPDGYESWCPKEQFENQYLKVWEHGKVHGFDIDPFIQGIMTTKVGEKTAVTVVTLINGFEIVETSSALPENFDLNIGEELNVEKAKKKIWELLGFLHQSAMMGFKPYPKQEATPVE